MKKFIMILLLVGLGISFMACGNRGDVQENTEDNIEENAQEEKLNNEEETAAYNNQPKFDCSVNKMSEVLTKNKNLKLQNNKTLCIFKDKNDKFEIQIGAWNTEISEIYYTIYDKDPMNNEKVSDDFFKTLREILNVFSEELKEETIRQKFSEIKNQEQSEEWNYSDKISLFVGKMGKNFDFRIYPQDNKGKSIDNY